MRSVASIVERSLESIYGPSWESVALVVWRFWCGACYPQPSHLQTHAHASLLSPHVSTPSTLFLLPTYVLLLRWTKRTRASAAAAGSGIGMPSPSLSTLSTPCIPFRPTLTPPSTPICAGRRRAHERRQQRQQWHRIARTWPARAHGAWLPSIRRSTLAATHPEPPAPRLPPAPAPALRLSAGSGRRQQRPRRRRRRQRRPTRAARAARAASRRAARR
mmetsp:Transcript_2854/g.7669  ORF Transcript_2854/g.7669 Transcript_2854/m.7669 type:complete len:218 (-) Transcript_2854:826-1479(-)